MKMLVTSASMLAAMTSLALADSVTPTETASAVPAAAASAGLTRSATAEVATPERTGPVDLTDAQLDRISAGAPSDFAAGIACFASQGRAFGTGGPGGSPFRDCGDT